MTNPTTTADDAVQEAADRAWKREGGTAKMAKLLNAHEAAAEWRALVEARKLFPCDSALEHLCNAARRRYEEASK